MFLDRSFGQLFEHDDEEEDRRFSSGNWRWTSVVPVVGEPVAGTTNRRTRRALGRVEVESSRVVYDVLEDWCRGS